MKFLAVVAVISLAFSILVPFIFGEHYRMEIVEKGTPFTEEIEIDEEKNIEIFRVPAHNDVNGAEFYHDFKMRLTVTKIPTQKQCHISQMDSSLSSPGKLKADIKRTSSRRGQLSVVTQRSLVMVTSPANRRDLTKEILDFCGALPIYNTELVSNPSYEDGTAIIRTRRHKRQIGSGRNITDFKNCLHSNGEDMFKYIKDGNCKNDKSWDIQCKMIPRLSECFYYVTCVKMQSVYHWNCTTEHRASANPVCCDFICQEKPTKLTPVPTAL